MQQDPYGGQGYGHPGMMGGGNYMHGGYGGMGGGQRGIMVTQASFRPALAIGSAATKAAITTTSPRKCVPRGQQPFIGWCWSVLEEQS